MKTLGMVREETKLIHPRRLGKAALRPNAIKKFPKIGLAISVGLRLIGHGHESNTNSSTTVNLQPGGNPMDLHHPFVKEFPAHRETIRSLKLADGKFRAAFDEYHQLDDEICRIEEDVEYASDQQIDELKFKRAKLKDALFAAVQKHEAAVVR